MAKYPYEVFYDFRQGDIYSGERECEVLDHTGACSVTNQKLSHTTLRRNIESISCAS
jgi:hypothetical protein